MGDYDTIKIEIINDFRYIYVDSMHNLNISLFKILKVLESRRYFGFTSIHTSSLF